MPRIRGASITEHHEMVWTDLAEAIRQLLLERSYDTITMAQIATRSGLARNTLYNYAPDKHTLVLALAERVSRPMSDRVTAIASRSQDPATQRIRQIVEAVLDACTDHTMQLMFLPGVAPLIAESPQPLYGPFHSVVTQVANTVRSGIASGEFREVDDVELVVELLTGVMRAGAERIGRDPAELTSTMQSARQIILASLTRSRPD